MATKKKSKRTTKKTAAKRAAKKKVSAVPAQYSSVIPAFRVPQCAGAVKFIQDVFGAKVKDRYDGPNGEVYHCELRIGNTTVMCGDAPDTERQTLAASIYVKDCDKVFEKAIGLGASVKQPVSTQFYGDRSGRVIDSWGNEWVIATHVEDLSKKEILRRMASMPNG